MVYLDPMDKEAGDANPNPVGLDYTSYQEEIPDLLPDVPNVEGIRSVGNINLDTLPVIRNKAGAYAGIGAAAIDVDGATMLVPKAENETLDDALKQFKSTGQNLGTFLSQNDATMYANMLHKGILSDNDLYDFYSQKLPKNNNQDTPTDGMLIPGNIDLTNRPEVKNSDGTYSTVKTITVGTDQGTVLLPTIINGKAVSNEEAIQHFKDTGQSMGVFKDEESASNYDKTVHEMMGWTGKSNVWSE